MAADDTTASQPYSARLADKIADSLTAPLPEATPRLVYGSVSFPGKATAVIGMRRAGKTTYLHQLRRERLEAGAARELLPFVNFEDEQLAGLAASDLHLLFDEYYRRFPGFRGQERVTWCLDEIQVVPGWERFVRRALDEEKVEIFLSGSSAALLSREIATSMRGRAWEVLLHTFSFPEYLAHRGLESPRLDRLSAAKRSALERHFHDYLRQGGFPEAQQLEIGMADRLLRDYVDVAMMRDVVERHQVTNVTGLRWLVRQLLGNAAGLFSVEKFYRDLRSQGISISKDTVHALVGALEDCFLVRTVSLETDSLRRRMVNPRKAYPIDTGLIPVYDASGKTNLGHALETVVLLDLERRGATVTYVRTAAGHEVDFYARLPDRSHVLIQVSADLSDPATAKRELRALVEAAGEFPHARRLLLTLGRPAPALEIPPGVEVEAAYEWLLTPKYGAF